jgi:XTP/dITP diphosphohydrolase
MALQPIYFNTTNLQKFNEIHHLFQVETRPLRRLAEPVVEILDTEIVRVVKEKALAAYRAVRMPVFVEHGGVFIEQFNHLPGVLLKYMWEGLGTRVCELVALGGQRRAVVRTALCYCDGMRRWVHIGEVAGVIADLPRGDSNLQWDTVFIPEGETRTFAEMPLADKMRLAPAAQAYRGLATQLRG